MRNHKLDLLKIMKSGDMWLFLEATDMYNRSEYETHQPTPVRMIGWSMSI